MADLSGRMDTLEAQMTDVRQDVLQRPDLADFQTFQISWNSQFNALNNLVASIDSNVRNLQALFINLNMVVAANYTTLTGSIAQLTAIVTGHTGQYVTGLGGNLAHHGA